MNYNPMKMLELKDPVSMFKNSMQTVTKEIVRNGVLRNRGISLEFLDAMGDEIFITCEIDKMKTHILLTAEKRLPFGDSRQTIVENGLEFLFQDCSAKAQGTWEYSFDINDEDNKTLYNIKNEFFADYIENPRRDNLNSSNCRLILYVPVQGKTKDVDGMAVLEFGDNLRDNSGLVFYYNFRFILESDVDYL